MRIVDQRRPGIFEYLHSEFTAHRRKVLKEDFERITSLQMFEQYANRNSRTDKNGRSADDLGVRYDSR